MAASALVVPLQHGIYERKFGVDVHIAKELIDVRGN